MKNTTMIIKPSMKYKMDEDELKMHLHVIRKGASITKDKTKFNRKKKHKGNY